LAYVTHRVICRVGFAWRLELNAQHSGLAALRVPRAQARTSCCRRDETTRQLVAWGTMAVGVWPVLGLCLGGEEGELLKSASSGLSVVVRASGPVFRSVILVDAGFGGLGFGDG
jgi:hypothetical protein